MPPDNDVQQEIEQLEQRFAENAQGLVFAHLADAYRRAGEFAKAEGLLLHGLKNHPTYTSAYNVLGRVYLESERYADAHEQFSKVLELDPTNLIALQALGDLAARGGRLEDARSWYERMLQIDPRSKEAQEGMASLEAEGEGEEVAEAPEPAPAEGQEEPGELEAAAEAAPIVEEPEPEPVFDESVEAVEEVEAPWDFSALLGEATSETVDEPAESASIDEALPSVSDEASAPETPWEFAEETEAPESDAGAPEGEAAFGEGAELESIPVQGASSQEASEGGGDVFDLDDLDLGIMDDWTPGFTDDQTPPGAETFETESILESLGKGLDIDLGGAAFEEDEAEESEEPEPSPDEPVVTETMAELYVGQGLYEDALNVYRRLAEDRPEDEQLQERITELESKVAEARVASEGGEEELAELLELTQPVSPEPFAPEPAVVDPEIVEVENEVTEAYEPEAEVGSVFSIEDLAPSKRIESEFDFEDEAPVAGMDQLDPFAVSFDVFAVGSTPSEPAVESVAEAGAEEEVSESSPEVEATEAVVEEEAKEVIAEIDEEVIAEEITVEAVEDLDVDEEAHEEDVVAGEFVVEQAAEEETVEEETIVGFVDEADEGAIEVTVEPTEFVAEDEVPVAAFEIDVSDTVDEDIDVEAEEEGEEEGVEEVIVEEFPAEPVMASVEEVDDSPADSWALDVDIVGEEVGSELVGEDFGAEVVVDGPGDDYAADADLPSDFEASELVADYAPPEPELKEVPEGEEPEELTIESYLTGLLDYDPEAAAPEASPVEVAEADGAPGNSDGASPEDLEQFQNWLRSLKR
jgi:tetratricopeptide (TPR) repeat protein